MLGLMHEQTVPPQAVLSFYLQGFCDSESLSVGREFFWSLKAAITDSASRDQSRMCFDECFVHNWLLVESHAK